MGRRIGIELCPLLGLQDLKGPRFLTHPGNVLDQLEDRTLNFGRSWR
jgi:hypothetical protein